MKGITQVLCLDFAMSQCGFFVFGFCYEPMCTFFSLKKESERENTVAT